MHLCLDTLRAMPDWGKAQRATNRVLWRVDTRPGITYPRCQRSIRSLHHKPFSPTRLVLQKPNERGNLHYVECQSDEPSGEDAWDKFSREIAEYIRGIWPERFGGDHEYEMGSLKGTTIRLIESYYDKIGLPKLIDRRSPSSIFVVPQLVLGKEIYGRIW